MEYIYATLALHAAKQPITEESVKKVLTASGASVDDVRVKALVASLEGVNIDEAIAQAAVTAVAAAPSGAAPAKEEKKAEDEKSDADKEAEAASGLAALFG